MPPWVSSSYDDPRGFWKNIAPVLLGTAAGASRSSPFDRYNLFHELAGRHAPKSIAFAAEDGAETSYGDLCARAGALSACWRELGVAPAARIAVVARVSLDLVTASLAAWHCGAVVTTIPSQADGFVRRRYEATAPDFLVASASRASMLGVPTSQVLPAVAPRKFMERTPPDAYRYGPDDPAARFFSPVSPKGVATPEPFAVSAERLLLGALRDGVLLLALSAGDRIAAPEFCEIQWKPALLLAALATGSAFCEVDLDSCVRSPKRLEGIDVLAVGPQLREAITNARALPQGLIRRWIRNAATDPAHDAWARFAACEALEGALGMNAYANAAAAGMIAFSPWRRDPSANTVLRAPGGGYQIADVNLSGMDAISDSGVLTAEDERLGPGTIGRPVLAKTGEEYVFVTVLGAHRDGQTLPMDEIADAASSDPDVWRCTCVSFAQSARATSQRCALIVFARPTYAGDDLRASVIEAVGAELGDAYRPDRVEVVRIAPRKGKDGAVDADWCRTQYLMGALARKDDEAVFRTLGRLLYALERGEL